MGASLLKRPLSVSRNGCVVETVLLVATWLFVATHIDTLIVLIAFCADEDYRTAEVLVGHYVGFMIGLGGAIAGALLAAGFLQQWTFLLGTVPIAMGLWGLLRRQSKPDGVDPKSIPGAASRIGIVAAAGVGLSGENIAVFVPFFATLSETDLLLIVLLYLLGAALVFLVAEAVVRLVPEARLPPWIHRLLVPLVLIVVGSYVLVTGWALA